MKEKKLKNTVVLSGLVLKGCNLLTTGEFDFIVVSSASKLIVQIEAKRGNNEKNRENAEKQLNHGKEFFTENFPFPSSENWNYVKMMCFGESVENNVCDQCNPFVLGSNFIKDKTILSVSDTIGNQFLSFLNTTVEEDDLGKTVIFLIK